MQNINIQRDIRVSALCLPVFMLLAFMTLGMVAHNSGLTAAREASGLTFPGQGLLEAVNPRQLMQNVVWLPFRNAQAILYRDLSKDSPFYRQEVHCLAQAVYFEARNEPLEGQMAVAQVVLNRVKSPDYPKSICAVVFQGEAHHHACQFSFACDGQADKPVTSVAWKQAMAIGLTALARQQDDLTLDATHYHASYVDPTWAATLKPTVRLGRHIFYRDI